MLTEWSTGKAPVVIGGVGGSGTRVVAQAVQNAGIRIGSDTNASLDNLTFSFLFKRQDLWPLEKHTEEIQFALELFSRLERGGHKLMLQEKKYLERVSKIGRPHHGRDWLVARLLKIYQLREVVPADVGWGWKEPNSHVFLPELFRFFPEMRYIHVVRNGQDMAFSENQSQLRLWGCAFGGRASTLTPQGSFDYWCLAHERILRILNEYSQQALMLNFDEFCRHPSEGLNSLYEFLGVNMPPSKISKQISAIVPPGTTGRHALEEPLSISPSQSRLLAELGYA